MTILNEPLYQKIYDFIVDRLKNGELAPGDRVPSEAELAIKFDVSRITSKKALEMLASKGAIYRIAGKGSFVAEGADEKLSEQSSAKPNKQESKLIGYITTDFSDTYGSGLVSGVERKVSEYGYNMLIKRTHGDAEAEEAALNSFLELGVDGIVMMPVQGEYYNDGILKLYLGGFPMVFLDRYLKGLPIPYVTSNNLEAAKSLTNYLFDSGHKNIALLSTPILNTSTLEERLTGFTQSHAEREVPLDQSIWIPDITCTLPGMFSEENKAKDEQRIINLIKNNPQITAIFASEYNIAYIAELALNSIGKKVPQDIEIVCFDGPRTSIEESHLTHARQNEEGMGAAAVSILKKLMDCEDEFERQVIVESEILVSKFKDAKR